MATGHEIVVRKPPGIVGGDSPMADLAMGIFNHALAMASMALPAYFYASLVYDAPSINPVVLSSKFRAVVE